MLKVYVDGMMHKHSESHIKAALRDLEGMREVKEINLQNKYFLISCSTEEATLRAAINDEGYKVTKIEKC